MRASELLAASLLILPYVTGQLEPCTNGKDGWYGNNGYCYNFIEQVKTPRTWQQAENYCVNNLDAHLISIVTKEENEFIKKVMDAAELIRYPSAWIGLRAQGLGSTFKWADGAVLDYINWNGNGSTPIPDTRTSCVVVLSDGKWGATDCTVAVKGFICKKDNATIEPVTEPPIKQGNCPDEWYKFNGKCYKPFGDKVEEGGAMDYDNALKSCKKLNSSLTTIHSQEEQDFLTARMGELKVDAWIGLMSDYDEGGWRLKHQWIDKSPLNYVNWAPGEPSSPYQEPCVQMYHLANVGGKWNDVPCDKKLGYICAKDVDPTITVPGKVKEKFCSYQFQRYRTGCYGLFTGKQDFQGAQKACKNRYSNLASINDTFEQAFVNSLLVNISDNVWIGLSDTDEKKPSLFSWTDGWPVYFTKWDKNQPQAEPLNNRCVSITENNTWTISNCSDRLPYLCKTNDEKPPDVKTVIGSCPESTKVTWKDVGNSYCYVVEYRNQKTWDVAARTCRLWGGKLASFHTPHELEVMRPLIQDTDNTMLWVGLVRDEDGGFTWEDGTAAEYVPWDNGEPSDDYNEDCVEILGHKMKYNDIRCNEKKGYICEIPKIPGPTVLPTLPPRTDCGPDYKQWKYFNDTCYLTPQTSGKSMDWHDANDFCNNNGGHLLSIHTAEENNFVFDMVQKSYYYTNYWLGLSATSGDTFQWSDETIFNFDALNNNSQEAIDNFKKCVGITRYDRSTWTFETCSSKRAYICKRAFGVTPSTITPKPTTATPGICPGGFTRIGNKCIGLFGTEEKANFTTALSKCKDMGDKGNLVSITNDREQAFVTSLLLGQTTEVWMGLTKKAYASEFIWTDGARYKYENWGSGEPSSSFYGVTCGIILTSKTQSGKWKAINVCNEELSYICEVSPSTTTATTPIPVQDCGTNEEGYVKYGNSCFKLYMGEEKKTWNVAESACKKVGGHLASINSGFEQSFIDSRLYSVNDSADSFWIGLSEEKRRFKWADKWPIYYTNWGVYQPVETNGTKRCAYLDANTKQWNATDCNDERNYICEISKDKPPVIPEIPNKVCPNNTVGPNWVDPDTTTDYCYYVSNERTSWANANLKCLKMDAEIASIHSQHEVDLLGPRLKNSKDGLWIGLIQKSRGEYGWHDSSPLDFEAWESKEPKKNAYDPCVALNPATGKWITKQCSNILFYICKIQKVQGDDETEVDPSNLKSKSGMAGGGIAGIVIFVIMAITGLVGGAYFYMKKRSMLPSGGGGGSSSNRKGVSFANDLYEPDTKP